MANKNPWNRNGPCHCGSGKKYKKCCMEKDEKNKPKNTFREELDRQDVSESEQLRRDQKLLMLQLEAQADMHVRDEVYLNESINKLREQIITLEALPFVEKKPDIIANIREQIKGIENAIKASAPTWSQTVYLATLQQVVWANESTKKLIDPLGKQEQATANVPSKSASPRMGPIQTDEDDDGED